MDQRVYKTKRDIKSAFKKLLLIDDFNKITVSQICKEARVNRITFYNHYKDKYDVFNEGLEDIVERIMRKADENLTGTTEFDKILNYCLKLVEIAIEECYAQNELLLSVAKEANSMLGFMIEQILQKKLVEIINNFAKINHLKYAPDFIASFFCGGLSKVAMDWFIIYQSGMTKQDLIRTLQELIHQFIKFVLIQ